MKYRMIALDLDGTLTNSNKDVTPYTRETLIAAMEQGAIVVLASGRPTYGIEPVADCLEMNRRGGYVLSYNGGKIVDWRTKEELYAKHLPHDVLPILHNYARTHGHALIGYSGLDILTEMPDDPYVAEEARINRMNIRRVDNLLEALPSDPTKLLMTGEPTLMLKAEEELLDLVGDRMDLFRSAPFFIELVPKGIDKALSLQRLLSQLRLTQRDLIAFGDGYNDLSMIRFAGMGVAMGNAAAEVRAAANHITASNDEDGVAQALAVLQ